MAKKSSIFRKESLDRLASPDQLDQLVTVTSPTGWLALLGCFVIVIMAVIWGIRGELPTNVVGQCILMKSEGVKAVTFSAGGRVTDIAIQEGDLVQQGQVIARVQQPGLLGELRNLEEERNDLIAKIENSEVIFSDKSRSIKNQITLLTKLIKSDEDLFQAGLITHDSIDRNKTDLDRLESQLKQLPVPKSDLISRLNQLERLIEIRMRTLDDSTLVYSSHSGRVLELMVSDGQLVGAGTSLLSIEPSGLSIIDLEAVIYLPTAAGKQVRPGMSVSISPSNVKREEYGTMVANVSTISAFPTTRNGMMRTLQNEQLVNVLGGSGSTIAVVANLIPDTTNQSGYRWTSPAGPPVTISTGTLCSAQVTTMRQAPITLIIPALKKIMGIY
jgi:HlyD family secretion protein